MSFSAVKHHPPPPHQHDHHHAHTIILTKVPEEVCNYKEEQKCKKVPEKKCHTKKVIILDILRHSYHPNVPINCVNYDMYP